MAEDEDLVVAMFLIQQRVAGLGFIDQSVL
jgi:hypothetical protein